MPRLSGTDNSLTDAFAPVGAEPALGLAVSGGPDSLALMVLAARWAESLAAPPRLMVYTMDHGLRPEAADEAAMVLAAARGLGLDAHLLRWAGPHPASGVQAAARSARYRQIGAAMREDGVSVLLTAHHADDQAETILMRLAHGSGLAGLAGMAAWSVVEGVRVFRPFLAVPGAALRAALDGTGLVPARDPSNADPHYERVRWRNMLPELSALGLDAGKLAGFARRMAEAEAVLAEAAERAFSEGVVAGPAGSLAFAPGWFAALPAAIATRVLQQALAGAGGRGAAGLGAVEVLRDALAADPMRGKSLSGCVIKSRAGLIHVCREPKRFPPEPALVAPGSEALWDGRFVIANRRNAGPVRVAMAADWNRGRAETFLGEALSAPSEAIRAAPVVEGEGGQVLAFGLVSRHEGISVVTKR